MSDGDPSLEEVSPLEEASEGRAFLAGTPGPLAASLSRTSALASPLRLRGALESALLINEARGIQVFKDMRSDYTQTDNEPKSSVDLKAMSVLSMYQDTISVDMNTERDNESVASTRLADEIPCSAMLAEPENTPAFSRRNQVAIEMTSQISVSHPTAARNPSLFFRDGLRSVDFVLVWQSDPKSCQRLDGMRRDVFERGLRQEGLHIEREPAHGQLNFVKIHAPHSVLKRYSEILKLRMPMKEELCRIEKNSRNSALLNATLFLSQKLPGLRKVHTKTNSLLDNVHGCWERLIKEVKVDTRVFPEKSHRFTAIYSRDKEYLFDFQAPRFWSGAICSRIVQFVLDRQRFSIDRTDDFAFGVERLIAEGVYTDAYPLHDGDLRTPGSTRYLLYNEWASVTKCFRYQPLDYIKDYFGVKIALYFAWLGFYTHMLLPAALVGLACFIYSVATLYDNQPSEDVCNDDSEVMMCPLCDYWCDYWHLKETCLHSRVTYLFDNPTTVFFAIFMSFWAALFLELWKRYSAEITHRWDLTGFDVHEEHPRPQYLARLSHVKKKQVNVVTNTLEPHVPFWRMRLPATILSFSIVLLLVSLALAAVLAVVLYRMSLLAALSVQGSESVITSYAILFTTATAASINLCLICVFNWMYTWLAEKLTEQELLRTQTEFDDSLTLKIYLLQFVNYYASIFYIAFFKGKFVGRPGDYSRFFGYRQEECGPGGCLMELCIQLSIIMIGKQAVNTVLEIALPAMYRWYNSMKTWKHTAQASFKSPLQWVKDYKLVEWGSRGLFGEYLEMVLQYGFVTIFVAAFPLAPLFALLNNILEMRLDAMKLLRLHRRPVPMRVRDIGVWYRILDSIGKLSVITNGFIIAFTSEFIPRLVYRFIHSPDGSLKGYLNHSLALFNITQLEVGSAPHFSTYNLTLCRYPDYRHGPLETGRYEHTATYWHILAARLAFIVVFENFVALVMIMVRWMIPDMSSELRDRIRRETYVINEIIINRERHRAGLLSPTTHNAGDLAGTEADWDHLLSRSLSGSEFDLMRHGSGDHSTANHKPVEV